MEFRTIAAAALALMTGAWSANALAWGQEGHSIIAEVAEHRLTPQAQAEVDRLLGPGRSLASISSWADDVRDQRPETYNWHFVDIPLAESKYDPARDCKPTEKGDCIVAALERLTQDLRCGRTDDQKRDALRFIVHLVGDIHQPLHTVAEARGGNDIPVEVRMAGAKTCRGGPCPVHPSRSNFHAVWDGALIRATTWSWGAYVDRLETGWLSSPEAQANADGTPATWGEETHRVARGVWDELSEQHLVDNAYYAKVLPVLDRQLGLAGLRLARYLNEAYGSTCSAG
jgi:hypothetical protein